MDERPIQIVHIRDSDWAVSRANCPKCNKEYDALDIADDKGLDIEGNFLGADPGAFTCECGALLTVEVDWWWRLRQIKYVP